MIFISFLLVSCHHNLLIYLRFHSYNHPAPMHSHLHNRIVELLKNGIVFTMPPIILS